MKLILAAEIIFDEAKHEYFYRGKKLSGVTGLIAKKLGLKFQSEFVGEHAAEGIHVHKAVQKWIETGESGSIHHGVQWVVEKLKHPKHYFSEVLVSDFKQYASSVDIVFVEQGTNNLCIYDIKKGKFNREYVTWQLSVYKYLIEKHSQYKVTACFCLAVKDKEEYPIFPKKAEAVEELLYGLIS